MHNRRQALTVVAIALVTGACSTAATAPSWSFDETGQGTNAPGTLADASPAPSPLSSPPVDASTPTTAVAAAPSTVSDATVAIANFAFGPQRVTVGVGGSVTWTNQDGDSHSVALGGQESPILRQGQTWSRTFDSTGQFAYACGLHDEMTGTVMVVGADGLAPPTAAGNAAPESTDDADEAEDADDD